MNFVNSIFETLLERNEDGILKEVSKLSEMDKDKLILKAVGEAKQLRAINDKYIEKQALDGQPKKTHPDDVNSVPFTTEQGLTNADLRGKVFKVKINDDAMSLKELKANTFIGKLVHDTDGKKGDNLGAFKFEDYDVKSFPDERPTKILNPRTGKHDFWVPRNQVISLGIPTSEELSAAE